MVGRLRMDSGFFMQNEPNSASSRPRHWRAGDAGSRHADKLGPRWIGWPRLARNGTGRPGNWTTRVQRVPPEEWRVADGGCRTDDEYGVSLGGWVAGNSSEPMAQEYPDVPAEEDHEPKKAPNKANLESTQTSSLQKVESGLTGPAGRKQSQSRTRRRSSVERSGQPPSGRNIMKRPCAGGQSGKVRSLEIA